MIPSTKAFVERTGNMLDKLASKMHKTIGRRADMYIEDSESIDMNSCRVMVAYAKHIGPVDSEQLSEFVIREFNGKLVPNLATAQSFTDLGRVMVILTRAHVTRPMEDAQHMHSVAAGAVYIDKTLADTWEVATAEDGQPFLSRVATDDIANIVAVRRQRMSTAGQQPMSISAAMQAYGGTFDVGPGDTVKVMYKDAPHSGCTVASVGDDNVTVKIPRIGTATVSKHAVFSVEQIDGKRLGQMKKELDDYYTQVYGPEYAGELTKETTRG